MVNKVMTIKELDKSFQSLMKHAIMGRITVISMYLTLPLIILKLAGIIAFNPLFPFVLSPLVGLILLFVKLPNPALKRAILKEGE